MSSETDNFIEPSVLDTAFYEYDDETDLLNTAFCEYDDETDFLNTAFIVYDDEFDDDVEARCVTGIVID
jgi:hypothetical protein